MIHALQHIPPFLIYLLVTAFLLLESSGIPVVNTTLLLCAGALAALGRVNLVALMFVAIAGSTLGACLAYGLGKRYGEPLLFRLARLLRIDVRKIALAESWFQKSGGRMIFFSRMLPYVRPFACFPAGISAMPFPRFLLAAVTGSTIWCIAFLIVGWELGPNWKLAGHLVRTYTLPALGVLLALLIIYLFARYAFNWHMKKRLEAQEKAAAHDRDLLEV